MGQRSVYDPHDPWAFRNTWTGEIRNSYEDLWIWVTLIVGLTALALCVLVPILIRIYCWECFRNSEWCGCFDRLLSVCYTTSLEQRERSRRRRPRTYQHHSDVESPPPPVLVQDRSRPRPRSYPKSFYPRSSTLPAPLRQNSTGKSRRETSGPSLPRLKLGKK